MLLEIGQASDFYRAVVPAYQRVRAAEDTAGDRLEVVFAPGTYAAVNLSLGDGLDGRPVDLILRAADAARPPVLRELSLSVSGQRVHLSGLIFSHSRSGAPTLRVVVGAEVTIERCAFVDLASLAPADGHLVELVAAGDAGQATASVRDCWFVGNWAQDGGTMLACLPAPPHTFGRLDLHNVACLDNHADTSVAPGPTGQVQLTACVVCEPADAGSQAPVPVSIGLDQPRTQVSIAGSLCVVEDLEHLVSVPLAHDTRNGGSGVTIVDSWLVLRRPPAAGEAPPGCSLSRTQVTRGQPAAYASRLAAVAASSLADARRGALPDAARLRAALLDRA